MRVLFRAVAPILLVCGIAACGASSDAIGPKPGWGRTNAQGQCTGRGEWCRWDAQCCSGRCYVDTGCSG